MANQIDAPQITLDITAESGRLAHNQITSSRLLIENKCMLSSPSAAYQILISKPWPVRRLWHVRHAVVPITRPLLPLAV